MTAIPAVALVGANGYGRWHRDRIAELQVDGRLRLVGMADVRPVEGAEAPVFTDHLELLAATRPDVVVICTPPHTHLPIARDAIAAGCDVLLEKPPMQTLGEHATLAAALADAGRACQVGFQALGSVASARLSGAITAGAVGTVTGITALGAWQRDDAYYRRAPWAGRRRMDGRPAVDGALVNPFAHALMQALAAAEAAGAGPPVRVEAERYRTRPIEADDTTVARITFAGGLRMVAAVTLAGEDFIPGEVAVTGTAGRALLEYPTDRLGLPGDAGPHVVPGRTDLLANLVDHRAGRAELIVPLGRTRAFTAVLEGLTAPSLPSPVLVDDRHVTLVGDGPEQVRVIRGVNAVLRRAVVEMALPSELGVRWAVNRSVRT